MLWFLTEEEDGDEAGFIFMEDEIWRALPEELLFAVLARLPVFSFIRFRSVCKRWNALLRYPSSLFSSPTAFNNKLLASFHTYKLGLIKVEQKSTEIHQFPQQQQRTSDHIRLSWRPFDLDFLHPSDHFVSSHSGLLLIKRTHTRYLVCNPLLRVSTEIPEAPIESKFVLLRAIFRMNPSSTTFKVICGVHPSLVNKNRECREAFLYDSSIRAWKNIDRTPIIEQYAPVCKNIHYWGTSTLEVLGFDFERETWLIIETILRVPESMPEQRYYTLCQGKDHLIMIAQLKPRRISIWLSSVSMEDPMVWDQIQTLTEDAIPTAFILSDSTCIGNILLLHNLYGRNLIAYNIVSKVSMVSYIANDPYLRCRSFLSFQPSLQAFDSQ